MNIQVLARRIAAFACVLALSTQATAQTPYVLNVNTSTGNDTLFKGVEGALIFGVDPLDIIALLHFLYVGDQSVCCTCGLIEQGV